MKSRSSRFLRKTAAVFAFIMPFRPTVASSGYILGSATVVCPHYESNEEGMAAEEWEFLKQWRFLGNPQVKMQRVVHLYQVREKER